MREAVEIFRGVNVALYSALPPTDSARELMFTPSIPFHVRQGTDTHVRIYNLQEYIQAYVSSGAAVLSLPVNELNGNISASMHMVTANGMMTAPGAFERAAVVYKEYADQIYKDQSTVVILVLCAAIIVLVMYLILSAYRTIQYCENLSSDTMLLFLSLPRSVVRLLQKRFVTALKNQGEEDEESVELEANNERKGGRNEDDDSVSDSEVSDVSGTSLGDSSYKDATSSIVIGSDVSVTSLARHRVSESRQKTLNEYRRFWRLNISARFFVLLFLAVIYVVVILTYLNNARTTNSNNANDIAASTERQWSLVTARYAARKYLLGLDTEFSRASCLSSSANLDTYISALAYGNKHLGLLGSPAPRIAQQLFKNPCVPEVTSNLVGATEKAAYKQKCTTFENGLVTRGVQELLIASKLLTQVLSSDIYRMSLAAATNVYDNQTVPYQKTDEFYIAATHVLEDYIAMLRDILEPLMVMSTDLYRDEALAANEGLREFYLIFFVCGSIAIALVYVLLVYPFFVSYFESARSANSLLLAIPPDVTMKVPQVSKFVQDASIAALNSKSRHSGGSSGGMRLGHSGGTKAALGA